MGLSDLPETGTFDLTTTGRLSGAARTVEIWFVRVDQEVHVVGTPGPRDWLANLRADTRARVSWAGSTSLVEAVEVADPVRREAVARAAWSVQPWYAEQGHTLADWIRGAPMVRLVPR